MKKVLFFIDTLGYGGAEKVLMNLVNNLDKSKYDITVMTIFDFGVNKRYLAKDVTYKYIFKKVFRGNVLFFKLFSPKYLYNKYVTDKYDIVISYLEGNTTRILSGCPYNDTKKVAWVHVEMDEKAWVYPYRNKQECIDCYKKFDKIVGVSGDILNSFKQHIGNFDNLCVKYNSIDTDYIREKSLMENDMEFSKNVPNVISVGRLIEQKSYMRLMRIHKKLLDNGIKHNLYIVGEGHQREMLQNYITQNNLQNSAHLLGLKKNPWRYVAKSDLFVCSSIKEGFSTAVTEALILGVPVITTLCSGMNEMLNNGEFGVIVDNNEDALYEGMYKMLYDADMLKHYKLKSIERSKHFELTSTVQAVEEMLDNL